eukprot:m.21308 g.21308  ORF g.21308 m.21308 type:complete len:193 (+) comp8707_c0_seq2:94-672(+)
MATKEHCDFCFETLEAALLKTENKPSPKFENINCPLFVTWEKWSERHNDYILRGCIGTFTARDLHDGLSEFALTSAFRDSRFDPISASELPHLRCGVSLLTDFEDADDYLDWEVGTHGIWIEFPLESGRTTTATYLPQVMPEQGWTKVEAIDSLLRKGGYRKTIEEEQRQKIKLTRYQSSKIEISYEEWKSE